MTKLEARGTDSLIEVVLGGNVVDAQAPSRTAAIAARLREASKRIRTNRKVIGGGGFRRRRGERLFIAGVAGSFVLLVVVPILLAALYFGAIASDRFESEMQFSLRSYEKSSSGTLLALTGLPTGNLIQEARVVDAYIRSRALVDLLMSQTDLIAKYAREDADLLSRFDQQEPIEDFMKYWRNRVTTDVDSASGIVRVRVQAFTPQDALDINRLILAAVEKLVNEISERARADLLAFNERSLAESQDRLKSLTESMARLRNESGLIDPELYAKTLTDVVGQLDLQLAQIRVKRQSLAGSISPASPQVAFLDKQIESLTAETNRLRREIASPGNGQQTLSNAKALFDRYMLDQDIARKQYAQAQIALERARMDASRNQVYAAIIVPPTLPEEAAYPKRIWDWVVVLTLALAGWGALVGLGVLVRNHLAV